MDNKNTNNNHFLFDAVAEYRQILLSEIFKDDKSIALKDVYFILHKDYKFPYTVQTANNILKKLTRGGYLKKVGRGEYAKA